MYTRKLYVSRIAPFLGKPVVKVVTGMRRSGKSCLLRLLMDKLVAEGVRPERIIYVNKEDYEFDSIRTYHDLADHVRTAPPGGERKELRQRFGAAFRLARIPARRHRRTARKCGLPRAYEERQPCVRRQDRRTGD